MTDRIGPSELELELELKNVIDDLRRTKFSGAPYPLLEKIITRFFCKKNS